MTFQPSRTYLMLHSLRVTDFTMLGNQITFWGEWSYHLRGYEALRGIPHVCSHNCDIVFADSKTVALSNCNKEVDVDAWRFAHFFK